MAKTSSKTPWWLGPGTEDCSDCEQDYVYEMEYRCEKCDAPLCPMCALNGGEVVCRNCSKG